MCVTAGVLEIAVLHHIHPHFKFSLFLFNSFSDLHNRCVGHEGEAVPQGYGGVHMVHRGLLPAQALPRGQAEELCPPAEEDWQ